MLSLGLTGGIAAGKSLLASRFADLGAVLIDADQLAREVVEPGTEGLAEIATRFGADVLTAAGALNREVLGAKVFANAELRESLNEIVHPRVRAKAAALRAAAAEDAIVVQDIPLLVETGQGAAFHLVIVVDAPDDVRIKRMVELRGMTEQAAIDRMAAQASRTQRLAAADVVIDNSGSAETALAALEELWTARLLPFAQNLRAGTRAARVGGARLAPYNPDWPVQAERLSAKIHAAVGASFPVDHIGSTAVPGLAAKDILDLQLRVPSLELADELSPLLGQAGFPLVAGIRGDTPKSFEPDPAHWQKRFHANADPGRAVNLHVRVDGSAGAHYALAFRDWLRAEPAWQQSYLAEKRRAAAAHVQDMDTAGYAEAKEPWFTEIAEPALAEWKTRSGWTPPRGLPLSSDSA